MPGTPVHPYRIGEFAKHLGVTPDLLKHYEEFGLLDVHQTESGYRFYGFDQAACMLEYFRYRNYGFSIREMKSMLERDEDGIWETLDDKAAELEREIARQRAILEEHRKIVAWHKERQGLACDWEVRQTEAHYFLPHSAGRDFVKDDRVKALLTLWYAWMPVVKSGMTLVESRPGGPLSVQFGLIVRESHVKQYGIPVNDIVRPIPSGKAFVYHFAGKDQPGRIEDLIARRHPFFDKVHELGFTPKPEMYVKIEFKRSNPQSFDTRWGYGRFVVPIEVDK